MNNQKPLEYKNEKGNGSQKILIGLSCGFFSFFLGCALCNGYTLICISLLIITGIFLLWYRSWTISVMSAEMTIIQEIYDSNMEIINNEQTRIESEMKLEEKKEKNIQKKLEAESKKLEREKIKDEMQRLKLDLARQKYGQALQTKEKSLDSINNVFDSSAQMLLAPIIRQAKKDKRQVSGQELISVILGGIK